MSRSRRYAKSKDSADPEVADGPVAISGSDVGAAVVSGAVVVAAAILCPEVPEALRRRRQGEGAYVRYHNNVELKLT